MKNQISRKRRKKKIKIRRFRLFMSTSLFIFIIFLGFKGISSVQGVGFGKGDLEISLSQDLNLNENESLFELALNWPALDEDVFENIMIKIDDREIELDTSETSFAIDLFEPETEYTVEFKATRRRFGFSKTEKIVFKTLGNNEVLNQSINNLEFHDDHFSFEHTLTDLPNTLDVRSVKYELMDLWQQVSIVTEAELLERDNGRGTFKVTVPLDDFLESPLLSLNIYANNGDTSFFGHVTDTNEARMVSDQMLSEAFMVHIDNNQFILRNKMTEQYTYLNHNFFAESLHLTLREEDEVATYQIVTMEGDRVVDEIYSHEANSAINLSGLDEGRYFVLLDESLIHLDEFVNDVWYTITRNGFANKITVYNLNDLFAIKVEKVSQLPEDVYDILIDPGHGGLDGGAQGNGLSESEEVLRVSEYITERLDDHGLKIKMSRTGDYEPSGDETFNWVTSPYFENGRVSQAYQYQTKYLISSHMNALNGEIEGFEIYSSIFTTDDWSQLIVSELKNAGHSPRDSYNALGRISEGSFKSAASCQALVSYSQLFGCTVPELDSLYIIRESGGQTTFASEMVRFNPDYYPEVPNNGSQSVLIEFMYIDNVQDANKWSESWKTWGEAVVKATLEYLGIEYISR